jgi:hypothetical protein
MMNRFPPRLSAARRNAEAMLKQTRKKEANSKLEQERERGELALKSARLRELRLAKEAADREAAAASPPAARKAVRAKQK